jgi:hypothetical protein
LKKRGMGRENGAGGGTEEEVAEKGKKKKKIKHTSRSLIKTA